MPSPNESEIYKIVLESNTFNDLHKNLKKENIDLTKEELDQLAIQFAEKRSHMRVAWLKDLGADPTVIAKAYSKIGCYEQVEEYRVRYKAKVDPDESLVAHLRYATEQYQKSLKSSFFNKVQQRQNPETIQIINELSTVLNSNKSNKDKLKDYYKVLDTRKEGQQCTNAEFIKKDKSFPIKRFVGALALSIAGILGYAAGTAVSGIIPGAFAFAFPLALVSLLISVAGLGAAVHLACNALDKKRDFKKAITEVSEKMKDPNTSINEQVALLQSVSTKLDGANNMEPGTKPSAPSDSLAP